jgi:hypothetical protein
MKACVAGAQVGRPYTGTFANNRFSMMPVRPSVPVNEMALARKTTHLNA